MCPVVWKNEGEQGAGDAGAPSCALPMLLPPRKERPVYLHLRGEPFPQVRATPSGVGKGPHLTRSLGRHRRSLGAGERYSFQPGVCLQKVHMAQDGEEGGGKEEGGRGESQAEVR